MMELNELKEALEKARAEKKSLLKELRHRVSNNLQLMSSILRLSLSASTDGGASKALADAARRLHALEVANALFLNRQDAKKFELYSFMHDLTRDLRDYYDPESLSLLFALTGQRIYLATPLISPLGIITGEIVSNSLDRAHLRGQRLRLDISWEAAEQGQLSLSYCDTSGGFPGESLHSLGENLGMVIIRSLAAQMQAKVTVANSSSMGAVTTIELHLEEELGAM